MFDLTINLGLVLQTMAIAGGGIYFLIQMKHELHILKHVQQAIDSRLTRIDMTIANLSNSAVEIARQDERLSAMDIRLQELSNRISSCESKHRSIQRSRASQ